MPTSASDDGSVNDHMLAKLCDVASKPYKLPFLVKYANR